MKLRFVRQTLPEFVAALMEVSSVEELYSAIRAEKNLSENFGLEEALKITPYKEYVAPEASFEHNYQMYVIGVGLIGFCDGPLKTLQPAEKKKSPKGPYYIDTRRVEHGCCWSSAILRPITEEEKKAGITRDVRIIECDAGNARMIRDALNVYHSLNKKE